MRDKHCVHFAGSGRINLAGLTTDIVKFIAAVADVTG
jgi:aromatic-amino-acid transaminase